MSDYKWSSFEKVMKKLDDARCQDCLGYGTKDDAELGDISFNQWKCPKCNGTGFKKGKAYDINRSKT